MSSANPSIWKFDIQETYVPVSHEGNVIGFCKPRYAKHMVKQLTETERLQKALKLACYDLMAQAGSSEGVNTLVQKYLDKVNRPLQGVELVAAWLKQRQQELDLTEEEFAKFCDSYRLSRAELKSIYKGEDIESHQLSPLARILGKTVDEIIEGWKGE
jgi:hypothetical protein